MSNIVVISHAWHFEQFGGAYKLAGEFAAYLHQKGYSVDFVHGTNEEVCENPVIRDGISYWRYKYPKTKSPSLNNLYGHINESKKLLNEISMTKEIHCVNSHSPLQAAGAWYALSGKNVRKAYSVHSPYVREMKATWPILGDGGHTIFHKMAFILLAQIERYIYKNATVIQCDSQYSCSLIEQDYKSQVGNKGNVASGWVDLDRFRFCDDKPSLKKKLGNLFESEGPVFLSVRRLEKRMGLLNLVNAAKRLSDDGYMFRLIIGGSGNLKDEIEAFIINNRLSDKLFLAGRISEDDLPRFYGAADCFILPTQAMECFGLIVLEAYASGTPVIATPIGAIPEVMKGISDDWLCDSYTADDIYRRMRDYLDANLKYDSDELRSHSEEYSSALKMRALEELIVGPELMINK